MKIAIVLLAVTLGCALVANAAALPPGEAGAKDALNTSPRHGEWVDIQVPEAKVPLRAYVVYPERKDKAPVVIVIQEIYGLTDWIRAVADQLAADGFIAIAPDLLSGKGPDGGGTESIKSRDDVTKFVRELTQGEVKRMLDAVRAYGEKLPSSNGKSATVGYCWGGSMSFWYATQTPDLSAAVVYYGTAPDAAALEKLKVPVLGLYGGDDARVNTTIEPAQKVIEKIKGSYTVHVFDGAGHGFLRQQDGRGGANLRAAREAWPATIEFLREKTR